MKKEKFISRKDLVSYLKDEMLLIIDYFGPEQPISVILENNEIIDYNFFYKTLLFPELLVVVNATVKKMLVKLSIELYPELNFASLIVFVNRQCLRLSAHQFAEKLNVTSTSIYRWEKGEKKPSIATKKRIAYELGFDIREFEKDYWDIH